MHTSHSYRFPAILVEPEGFQLELEFMLLAPLHEVRLGSRQLTVFQTPYKAKQALIFINTDEKEVRT